MTSLEREVRLRRWWGSSGKGSWVGFPPLCFVHCHFNVCPKRVPHLEYPTEAKRLGTSVLRNPKLSVLFLAVTETAVRPPLIFPLPVVTGESIRSTVSVRTGG